MLTRSLSVVALSVCGLLIAGCAGGRSQSDTGPHPDDLQVLRTYDLRTEDADPQPEWAPTGNLILIRTGQGLGVIGEMDRRRFFDTPDGRRPGHPTWLDDERVMYGPDAMVEITEDGRVMVPAAGLVVIGADENGRLVIEESDFGDGGYRPVVHGQNIYAQRGEQIVIYDRDGDEEGVLEVGFLPVVQPDGPGYSVQTVPVIAPNRWTDEQSPGDLLIRWGADSSRIVPGVTMPVWRTDGTVIAHRPHDEPPIGPAWWRVGSDLVRITEDREGVRTIIDNCHSPTPHPELPILAAINSQGELVLVNEHTGEVRMLEEECLEPQWNASGDRLLAAKTAIDGTVILKIWVFNSL